MKDKEFDKLLSQSLKEHGHEYLHGADGPLETGPVPVHQFRDDFLSDIVANKPDKKKNKIKYVRFISTVAAAFVVALAAVIIVPQLVSRKTDVVSPDTKMPWESSVANNAAAEKASDTSSSKSTKDELGKTLDDSSKLPNQSAQTSRKQSDTVQISDDTPKTSEGSYKESSAKEYPAAESTPVESRHEDYPHEEVPAEEPAYEDPSQEVSHDTGPSTEQSQETDNIDIRTDDPEKTGITLPEDISFTMTYNGSEAAVTKNELNALTAALAGIISADNYTETPYTETPVICDISIDSSETDGKITVNGVPFGSMSIRLYPSKLFVTISEGNESMTFCVDNTSESYNSFRTELNSILG